MQRSLIQDSGQRAPGRWLSPVLLVSLLTYFFAFSWDRVFMRFAADDMMNMGIYFRMGPWRALASQFLFWQNWYRPMGAAFYMPLHHWFGLNPMPFQAAIVGILAINLCLGFGLLRVLGCGRVAAGLASLITGYHAGLANLHYNIDMVYDVLCFLFFAGTLLCYVSIRSQKRSLRWPETALFLALYLCALNSKEMALTIPFVILSYEVIYHRPFRNLMQWLRGPGILVAATGVLAAVDFFGKRFGPDALMNNAAYQPVFSLQRWIDFQKGSLHDLLCYTNVTTAGVILVWLLATFLAWRRDQPALRFAWAYMVLTPLPIAFLSDRFQGCLYIPLLGWAVLASMTFTDLAQSVSNYLAKAAVFRRAGAQRLFAIFVAAAVILWAREMTRLKASVVVPAAAQQGIETWDVIQQLQALHPHVQPNSKVVFLNDPFTDWDMTFIGMLWFHDRSVEVHNARLEHLAGADLNRMDYAFDFRDGKLVQLK
ncbi:MAG: hypothetical protein C5B51_05420 [Terriglobia bacterium]|nr:MAG: hypothetical protein C5B51_05420 [Terriglobia bacterium]